MNTLAPNSVAIIRCAKTAQPDHLDIGVIISFLMLTLEEDNYEGDADVRREQPFNPSCLSWGTNATTRHDIASPEHTPKHAVADPVSQLTYAMQKLDMEHPCTRLVVAASEPRFVHPYEAKYLKDQPDVWF